MSSMIIKQGLDEITPKELHHIQQVSERFPKLSRTELASTLCEHLQWLSPSGALKKQKALQVLERLAELDLIELPASRVLRKKGADKPIPLTDRSAGQASLTCSLKELPAVELTLISERPDITLWNEYVQRYHPLGHKRPFGNWLRYFVRAGHQVLGCILISGAAKALLHRDRWIGWDATQRRRNLPWVINNSRYLVFPWVQVPHLASHVLGQLSKRVAQDWAHRWGYCPVLMETFVDATYYEGTCYRAAGWEALGTTSGRGISRADKRYHSTPKLIFAKPLHKHFRSLLTSEQLQGRIIE